MKLAIISSIVLNSYCVYFKVQLKTDPKYEYSLEAIEIMFGTGVIMTYFTFIVG